MGSAITDPFAYQVDFKPNPIEELKGQREPLINILDLDWVGRSL